jgi:acetyl esterase/lipase
MTTDPTRMHLVHPLDAATPIAVEHDHTYPTERGPLGFTIYRPPHAAGPTPAVVFVSGYPDPGLVQMFGAPLQAWASYVDWARRLAAAGIAAITYANHVPDDADALVAHLRAHADRLGIDPARIGLWACSGNAPTALGVLARHPVRTAALLYPFLLDVGDARAAAEASARFFFALPPLGVDDLPARAPLLVVRAGHDATPGLDATLTRFVAAARARGLEVELVEHADAPHAFDLVDDTPATRAVIEQVVAYLGRALA